MFPELSDAQRRAVVHEGVPLAMIDGVTGRPFMLFAVELSAAPTDGVRAQVAGIAAIGEGDSAGDALKALALILRTHLAS